MQVVKLPCASLLRELDRLEKEDGIRSFGMLYTLAVGMEMGKITR